VIAFHKVWHKACTTHFGVVDYDKLRLDVLKSLIDGRDIECKQTKEEIIKTKKIPPKVIRNTFKMGINFEILFVFIRKDFQSLAFL
jgi:hypothetical protein